MQKAIVCRDNKIIKNVKPGQIKKYLAQKKSLVWLDLEKPDDNDYKLLKNVFKFHPLSIEDCAKSIELPKIDQYDNYLFIVLHTVESGTKKNYFKRNEVDFYIGRNFLVTVHQKKSPSIEDMAEKLQDEHAVVPKSADFLMYQIIDSMVDHYFPMLDKWEDRIEDVETKVMKNKPSKTFLKELMSIKRETLHLRKSITPQRDVINKLTKTELPFVSELARVYFRDVYDHILRVYTEIETQRDILTSVFEAYTSILSKQMAETSNKMNAVMQKLTIIATIFMPLTFITGVYGMNFRYMPELYWRYGYFIILGIMVLIGIMMYAFFRKKDWV